MFRMLLLCLLGSLLTACSEPPPTEAATAIASTDTSSSSIDGKASACRLLALKLIGEWQDDQSSDKTVFHEQWAMTDDWFYTGLGFVMSGKDTSFIEHLNIHVDGGNVFYDGVNILYSARIPSQNDGAYVDFRLTDANADSMVFENEEHDFPQRIVYAWQSDGTWKVNVSGPGKDGWRVDNYHFQRSGTSPE